MNVADNDGNPALIVAGKRDFLELMVELLEDVTVDLNAGNIDCAMVRVVDRLPIDLLCNKKRRWIFQKVTVVNLSSKLFLHSVICHGETWPTGAD